MEMVKDTLDQLQGAVMIVYPMGLPPYDPIWMEFENKEGLSGPQAGRSQKHNCGGPPRSQGAQRSFQTKWAEMKKKNTKQTQKKLLSRFSKRDKELPPENLLLAVRGRNN